MSRWQDAFNDHAVHGRIKNILALLSGKSFKRLDAITETEIARISKFVMLVQSILTNAMVDLVEIDQLNLVEASLGQIEVYLTNYAATQELSQLQSANSHVDATLRPISLISAMAQPTQVVSDNSINSIIARGDTYIASLSTRRLELQKQIAGLKVSSTALEKKLSQLEEKTQLSDEEMSVNLANFTKQFSSAEIDRTNRFDDGLSNLQDEATSKLSGIYDNAEKLTADKYDNFDDTLNQMSLDSQEMHKNIKTIHGLIAEDSITGGFKKNAEEESTESSYWRNLTAWTFISAIVWLAIVFFYTGGISWTASMSGMPVTFVLLSAASYFGFQSRQHRKQAIQQKQFSLEMLAIDPYLENLGEENRVEIKKLLAVKYFGKVNGAPATNEIESGGVLPAMSANELADYIRAINSGSFPLPPNHTSPSINSAAAQLFFNADELIVFTQALRPRQ